MLVLRLRRSGRLLAGVNVKMLVDYAYSWAERAVLTSGGGVPARREVI
jgi:hypothetical protein